MFAVLPFATAPFASGPILAGGGSAAPVIIDVTASTTSAVVTYSGVATLYRLNGGAPTALGASPATISGLTANTEYALEISADGSAWVGPANFGTLNPGVGGGEFAAVASIVGAGGIPSEEAFGVPTVVGTLVASISGAGGIPSAEAFGVPTVSVGGVALIVDAGGIPSEEAFGLPTVTTGSAPDLTASISGAGGIPSAEAFGVPTVVATGSGSGSGTGATAEQIAAAVWQHIVESGFSAEQLLRVIAAPLAGRATGIGTNVESYLAVGGTVPRVVAIFDSLGNRDSVTVDGSTV